MYKSILSLFILTLIYGCSEVPVVLPSGTIETSGKVVLVEDITGVDCSNCPRAVRKLEEISDLYPGSVLLVGIHGIQQAKPIPEKSKYDFRNEDAAFLEDYLRPWLGKPAASFNRTQFDDEDVLAISLDVRFQGKVERLLAQPQELEINTSHTYDPVTRSLQINAGVINVTDSDLTGEFKISAMILESHIVDYQLDTDFGGYDPNYEHNHVMRDMISNVTGDDFATVMPAGEIFAKSWNYEVPTGDQGLWKEENLEVIVFVTNEAGDVKEVVQAGSFKLME